MRRSSWDSAGARSFSCDVGAGLIPSDGRAPPPPRGHYQVPRPGRGRSELRRARPPGPTPRALEPGSSGDPAPSVHPDCVAPDSDRPPPYPGVPRRRRTLRQDPPCRRERRPWGSQSTFSSLSRRQESPCEPCFAKELYLWVTQAQISYGLLPDCAAETLSAASGTLPAACLKLAAPLHVTEETHCPRPVRNLQRGRVSQRRRVFHDRSCFEEGMNE